MPSQDTAGSQQVITRTKNTPLDKLRPHPDNPNNGDTDAITESLRINGQYRPIVANADGTILAGHHVYAAALELGWTHLQVTWVDVDDTAARRILIADNRIARLARLDDGLLAEILTDLNNSAGLEGTGYTDEAFAALLAQANKSAEPPEEFPAYDDETIGTNHECPRCGYTWSQ